MSESQSEENGVETNLPDEQLSNQTSRRPGRENNLVLMLNHRPDVLRTFAAFSRTAGVAGALPDRLKELAILRTSILNGCAT